MAQIPPGTFNAMPKGTVKSDGPTSPGTGGFWDSLGSTFYSMGQSFYAIGQCISGNSGGAGQTLLYAYPHGPLGQAELIGPGTYYTTGGSLLVGTGAMAAVGGLAVAGANPVLWGGPAVIATEAEAVTAFGGLSAFGRLIGMGNGPAAAIERTASITLAEIQAARITLPVARWWLQFYQNAVRLGKGGAAAPERVLLH